MWGGGISRDGASLVPNKPRTGVLVSLSHLLLYAGIHPTLYLFGFRANALNSHSPPYLPGFDPGSGLGASGASEPLVVRMLGLVVGFAFFGLRPYPCLADLNFSIFQASSSIGLATGAPKTTPRKPRRPRSLGLGFLNNLVNHRKGEGVP